MLVRKRIQKGNPRRFGAKAYERITSENYQTFKNDLNNTSSGNPKLNIIYLSNLLYYFELKGANYFDVTKNKNNKNNNIRRSKRKEIPDDEKDATNTINAFLDKINQKAYGFKIYNNGVTKYKDNQGQIVPTLKKFHIDDYTKVEFPLEINGDTYSGEQYYDFELPQTDLLTEKKRNFIVALNKLFNKYPPKDKNEILTTNNENEQPYVSVLNRIKQFSTTQGGKRKITKKNRKSKRKNKSSKRKYKKRKMSNKKKN